MTAHTPSPPPGTVCERARPYIEGRGHPVPEPRPVAIRGVVTRPATAGPDTPARGGPTEQPPRHGARPAARAGVCPAARVAERRTNLPKEAGRRAINVSSHFPNVAAFGNGQSGPTEGRKHEMAQFARASGPERPRSSGPPRAPGHRRATAYHGGARARWAGQSRPLRANHLVTALPTGGPTPRQPRRRAGPAMPCRIPGVESLRRPLPATGGST